MTRSFDSLQSVRPITGAARPVAVIDVGTSSIRMAIAEIDSEGNVRPLERLIQGVSLGKDTFSSGVITRTTIDACVRVLAAYREKLNEYHITSPRQIRVVATSAVREASNRMNFLDRVYSATGFWVDPISEAEISRVTYLGLLPLLRSEDGLRDSQVLVAEVGGGSTEVLMLRNEDVVHSRTYRLGSMRLRESLVGNQASRAGARRMLENQIDRTIEIIRTHVDPDSPVELVALGGDIRFAASQLMADSTPDALNSLATSDLARFADEMMSLSEGQIMQRYHLTLPDAESLGPALVTYLRIARELELKRVLVTDFNLRDALLTEMAEDKGWSEGFISQIIRSACDLGEKFQVDSAHAQHVARLAKRLFHSVAVDHRLGRRWEVILRVAALLHEVGLFIATSGYHKHSMYLISNSEVFGFGPEEVDLVALVARYHRRAFPKPSHDAYRSLDRDVRVAVSQVAAILRIADALDNSRSQRIENLQCELDDDRYVISVRGVSDLALERIAMNKASELFEETFGRRIQLRSA